MGDEAERAEDDWYALPWQSKVLHEMGIEADTFGIENRRARGRGQREGTTMTKSAAELQAELAVAQAALALAQGGVAPELSRWPAEPPVGTVVRFERVFARTGAMVYRGGEDTNVYTYVALRTGALNKPWYITGKVGRDHVDWPDLCAMIGDWALCEIATVWFEIPALEREVEDEPGDVDSFVALFGIGTEDSGARGPRDWTARGVAGPHPSE